MHGAPGVMGGLVLVGVNVQQRRGERRRLHRAREDEADETAEHWGECSALRYFFIAGQKSATGCHVLVRRLFTSAFRATPPAGGPFLR